MRTANSNRIGGIAVTASALMVIEVALVPYLDRNSGDWVGGTVLLMLGIVFSLVQLCMLPLFFGTKAWSLVAAMLLPSLFTTLFLLRFG